jgi:hypothetical protein
MVLPFCFPLTYFAEARVRKRTKNPAGKSPPPDSDPFSEVEFEKNLAACQNNLPLSQITDSSSINALSFSSARTTLSIVAVGVGNPDRVPLGRQEVRLQEETGCAAAEAVISSKEKCQGNELRFHFLNVE